MKTRKDVGVQVDKDEEEKKSEEDFVIVGGLRKKKRVGKTKTNTSSSSSSFRAINGDSIGIGGPQPQPPTTTTKTSKSKPSSSSSGIRIVTLVMSFLVLTIVVVHGGSNSRFFFPTVVAAAFETAASDASDAPAASSADGGDRIGNDDDNIGGSEQQDKVCDSGTGTTTTTTTTIPTLSPSGTAPTGSSTSMPYYPLDNNVVVVQQDDDDCPSTTTTTTTRSSSSTTITITAPTNNNNKGGDDDTDEDDNKVGLLLNSNEVNNDEHLHHQHHRHRHYDTLLPKSYHIPCPTTSSSKSPTTTSTSDASTTTTTGNSKYWIMGLVYDSTQIQSKILTQLLELNCGGNGNGKNSDNDGGYLNFDIHIMAKYGASIMNELFHEAQQRCYGGDDFSSTTTTTCGSMVFEDDPIVSSSNQTTTSTTTTSSTNGSYDGNNSTTSKLPFAIGNRVRRIAYIRDHQRDSVYESIMKKTAKTTTTTNGATVSSNKVVDLESSIVMLIDLDLYKIPTNEEIRTKLIDRIIGGGGSKEGEEEEQGGGEERYDVLCSSGLMHHPFGYYDIFATVLQDGTFIYPLSGRQNNTPMEYENVNMIRSNSIYGTRLTQEQFYFDYLLSHQQQRNADTVVPVRSCFGGLTMYRGSTYFNRNCRYSLPNEYDKKLDPKLYYRRFANLEDGQPCEHVLFHECLLLDGEEVDSPRAASTADEDEAEEVKIGIQSSITTWWDEPFHGSIGGTGGSIMTDIHSNGKISNDNSYIVPGGKVFTGLVENDGIMTSHQRLQKLRRNQDGGDVEDSDDITLSLRNGDYTLEIDEDDGHLVIYYHHPKEESKKKIVIWKSSGGTTTTTTEEDEKAANSITSTSTSSSHKRQWEYAFLTMERDGRVMLSHQYKHLEDTTTAAVNATDNTTDNNSTDSCFQLEYYVMDETEKGLHRHAHAISSSWSTPSTTSTPTTPRTSPCRRVVWSSNVSKYPTLRAQQQQQNDDHDGSGTGGSAGTSTGTVGSKLHAINPILHLGHDGILRVVDIRNHDVLWQSHNNEYEYNAPVGTTSNSTSSPAAVSTHSSFVVSSVVDELFDYKNTETKAGAATKCLQSGTDEDINKLLKDGGRFTVVTLCRNSTFLLSKTIHYTSSNQVITTEGYDSGSFDANLDQRATLRIVHDSVVTAINMKNYDHVELRNVIVDGNRKLLGKARGVILRPPPGTSRSHPHWHLPIGQPWYKQALIVGGGVSYGTIVSNIYAYDTRSWSILHIAEGNVKDQDGNNQQNNRGDQCVGAIIEYNTVGPGGIHDSMGSWSDGISIACTTSFIHHNTIMDVTDVGLVLFGSPGSIVEYNHILVEDPNVMLSGGISLVDYAPYNGNFTNSIIRNNIIESRKGGGIIGVGIAIGQRVWTPMSTNDLVEHNLVQNGTVVNNTVISSSSISSTFTTSSIQYGYAADGIFNWTIMDNVYYQVDDAVDAVPSSSPFSLTSSSSGGGKAKLLRGGKFLYNKKTSFDSIIQDDFVNDATVEYAIHDVLQYWYMSNSESEVLKNKYDEEGCLQGGNETTINNALMYGKAVLCENSIFHLYGPIVYTGPSQSIYTEGYPNNIDTSKYAILRIVDPSVSTAVNMLGASYATLSHVIIDGNRPNLGRAIDVDDDGMTNSPNPPSLYEDALIKAGGYSTNQIIRNITAYNTRSWATLHVWEGLGSRCRKSLIEYNTFGPSGVVGEEKYHRAVGMSMSCRDSIVRKNVIIDATDVGLSFFGAPGTIVEDNEIIANTVPCRAAISLVDVAPFDGNYNNSIIRNNKIMAVNSSMDVGIVMGPRAWEFVDDSVTTMNSKKLIYGAQVVQNVLHGDFSLHAMLVAGVRNWTVTDNIHVSATASSDSTDSLWMDTIISSGIFQQEFNTVSKGVPPRVYQVRNSSFPCFAPSFNQTSRGFFFAKIPRTGSTTIAGVHRRIAAGVHRRIANKKSVDPRSSCHALLGHRSPRLTFDYGNRDVKNSFLWTFLRNPADREVSFYFYNVSKLGWEATEENFQEVSISVYAPRPARHTKHALTDN